MKEKHTWIIISLDCKVQEVLSKGAKSSPHLKTCYFYFENISVGSTAIFSVALRPGRCPQLHSSPHYSPGNHRSSWVHLLFAITGPPEFTCYLLLHGPALSFPGGTACIPWPALILWPLWSRLHALILCLPLQSILHTGWSILMRIHIQWTAPHSLHGQG